MDYDFIEIGTSWFNTLTENVEPGDVDRLPSLCVEPIKEYLDKLEDKRSVKKINCAISFDNTESTLDIYYIPLDVLKENDLPWWLSGCNSTNDYHFEHKVRNITHLVKKITVPCIPVSKLFIDNNVGKLFHLKIDTEGGDCDILMHFLQYIKTQPIEHYPFKIQFESNHLTDRHKISDTIHAYLHTGYVVTHQDLNDTWLEYRPQS